MTNINDLISKCGASIELFVELLKREKNVLASRDIDKLGQIMLEKNQLAAVLSTHWSNLTDSLGLQSETPDAITAALDKQDNPAALKAWQKIVSLTTEASELNKHNGAIIRELLDHTKKAIDVLQAMSGQNATYGPDGQSSGGFPFTRSIDKA